MNAFLNVLILTLGTALAPSAHAAGPPAPMMFMGAAVPVYTLASMPQARGGEIPPPSTQSTCTATCADGSNVSCSGTNCTAQNQNCSTGSGGYVQCDGTYTYCSSCPPNCTFRQCRQGCYCPGGFSNCLSLVTCECECIYQ